MSRFEALCEAPGALLVVVRDLTIHAPVGIYESERRGAQPILVNLELVVRLDQPGARRVFVPCGAPPDAGYDAVVCYEALSNALTALAQAQHTELLETMIESMAALCLSDGRADAVRLRIEKPQAVPAAAAVGLQVVRFRA